MRRRGVPSSWALGVLVIGIASWLAACASTGGSSTVVPVSDVKSLAGKWTGVGEGPGSGQQDYVEMTIREDGSYDITTARTIGKAAGNGRITLRDGQVVMQGTHGTGVGSLMRGSGGERVLRVDVKFTGSQSAGSSVSANLRPAR